MFGRHRWVSEFWAYNIKQVIAIIGVRPLLQAIRA
jgi:hypothetical protein